MPFYHFEVRTQTHVLITEGAELADNTAARAENVITLSALRSPATMVEP